MIISTLNRFVHRHSRTAFIIIGALIIVPFVFLWGNPGSGGSKMQRDDKVGTMYGRTLHSEDFLKAMEATDLSWELKAGWSLSSDSRAQNFWVQETLRRLRGLKEADARNLPRPTDADVIKAIEEMPAFQSPTDKKFDLAAFTRFKDSARLKKRGINGEGLDTIVRENLLIDRLDKSQTDGISVLPDDVRKAYNKDNEKFTAAMITLSSADEAVRKAAEESIVPSKSVEEYFAAHKAEFAGKDDKGNATEATLDEPTKTKVRKVLQEAAAKDFYAKHVESYRPSVKDGSSLDAVKAAKAAAFELEVGKTDEQKQQMIEEFNDSVTTYLQPYYVPEQKKVRVVQFPFETYKAQVTIDDAQIQTYYDKNKAEYSKEEVKAQHILFKFEDKATPEQKAAKKKSADDLRAKIVAGADFNEMAKKFSDDAGSKEKNGDLGWFGKGRMVPPFEEAAFALKPGEVSEIVESQFGYHIIKLNEKRNGRPLADVQGEIKTKLQSEKESALAEKAARDFSDALYKKVDATLDAGGKAKPTELMQQQADADKIKTIDTDWFRAQGGFFKDIGYEQALATEGIKLNDARPVSDAIKGNKGWFVAAWLDTKAPFLPEFSSDLTVRVHNHMVRETAIRLAREKAKATYDDLSAKLKAGTAFDVAAADLKPQDVPEFTQKQPSQKLDMVNKELFTKLEGKAAGTLLEPMEIKTGAMLVFIKTRVLPLDETFNAEKTAKTDELKREKERDVLTKFYKKLEDDSKTELTEQWAGKKANKK